MYKNICSVLSKGQLIGSTHVQAQYADIYLCVLLLLGKSSTGDSLLGISFKQESLGRRAEGHHSFTPLQAWTVISGLK